MELTIEQKKEVGNYISVATRYKETYNEIYDHVLNALNEIDQPYHSDIAGKIIRSNFGSFKEIKRIERKTVNKTKFRLIVQLFSDVMLSLTLKNLPYTVLLFLTCFMLYVIQQELALQPGLLFIFFMFGYYIASFCWLLVNKYIWFGFKQKHWRNEVLVWLLLLPASFFPISLVLFLTDQSKFHFSDPGKVYFVYAFIFFSGLYLRSFSKVYLSDFKVLTV